MYHEIGWKKVYGNRVLYFLGLSWANITLDLWSILPTKLEWKKTIVVEGWNLYIKSNILKTRDSDTLWIIVLKDDTWSWGNIYINPEVTNIDALVNQLYIRGSVFSNNTIWWSRASPLICPYYIISTCTIVKAQTYDFNYLRRYFRYKDISGTMKVANSWKTSIWIATSDKDYPVVIKYDSQIQTAPPPLFYK